VVVDVGTGSGVLALFAVRAGARKVYAIERDQVVHLAKRLAAANGLARQIEFVEADVATVVLPEQADVLVSDCIASSLVNATMLPSLLSARGRLLKNDGVVIPGLGRLYACPVLVPAHEWLLEFWDQPWYGLDWRQVRPLVVNQPYLAVVSADDLLAEPALVAELDYRSSAPSGADLAGQAVFRLSRAASIQGIALWFTLQLSPAVLLSTSPHDPLTCWYQTVLPLDPPIPAADGDPLSLSLQARHLGDRVAWSWTASTPGADAQSHDSDLGYPAGPGLPAFPW
jgi:SAM-dependent methyltransferase